MAPTTPPADATGVTWTACAVCGYALVKLHAPDGAKFWLHGRDVHDHPPIPVSGPGLAINRACDFCDVDKHLVTDVIQAGVFDLPAKELDGMSSVGPWAACATCADYFRRKEWTGLLTYVRLVNPLMWALPARDWHELYMRLAAHTHGIIPVDEWRARIHPHIEEDV